MENKILTLIAQDRIEIPLGSLDNKLRRAKSKLAESVADNVGQDGFFGERVYAHVSFEDKQRARGMKEAVSEFCQQFPKYGQILQGKIAEKRVMREEHLYFGTQQGARLTTEDYMDVMSSLGLSTQTARSLYPDLLNVSRKLEKSRDQARSIIVGKYD